MNIEVLNIEVLNIEVLNIEVRILRCWHSVRRNSESETLNLDLLGAPPVPA
jgi:hypothetical protein